MATRWLQPNVPFHPKAAPIYYGWVVLGAGTLCMASAVPASPPGMAPFNQPMQDALGVELAALTAAYSLGSVGAAVATFFTGRLVDRWGARALCTLAFFMLGISLVFLAGIEPLLRMIGGLGHPLMTESVLVLGFFLVRFFGLGVAMTATRSMVIRWFAERRSMAVAIQGATLSICFSSAPVGLYAVVDALGWQGAWLLLGIVFAVFFSAIAWVFFRESPESVGVPIEGAENKPAGADLFSERKFPVRRDFALGEAMRTLPFWIYLAGLGLNGILGTGVAFNIQGIGE
ncbi:MAG: MFS transporter, partial [Verrucomicrobiota bacterium]